MPGIDPAASPEEKKRLASEWCDKFEQKNERFLKSSICTFDAEGTPTLTYEAVDTSLIPPRPRLYGLVGAEAIEEAWKERAAKHAANGAAAKSPSPALAAT